MLVEFLQLTLVLLIAVPCVGLMVVTGKRHPRS